MAKFINTVDVLGDDAVIDSIINGSITEYHDDSVTILFQGAFRACAAMTNIDCPAVTKIESGALRDCVNLASVNLPSVTSISGYSFSRSKITSVRFPLKITLGNYAFTSCSQLAKADFAALNSVGYDTLAYCKSLVALIIRGTENVANNTSYTALRYTPIAGYTNVSKAPGYIYVPSALVDSYKAATNWSTFGDQFRALEEYTVDGTVTGELDETKI